MTILNFIKTYRRGIEITLLIIVGVFILFYVRKLQAENEQLKQIKTITRIEKEGTTVKPIKVYTDDSGNKHVVIGKDDNTISKKSFDTASKGMGLRDTVILALKLAKDKIDQITKVNFSVTNKNVLLEKKIDSLSHSAYYEYNGKYLHYRETDIDSMHRKGNYVYDGSILYTDYSKKKVPIFGRTFGYTDIYSPDSNFRVNSVQRLTIEHAPKAWSFKIRVGTLYNIDKFHVLFGPKVEFGYKGLTLTGERYYNFNGSKSDLVGLDYTLISF